jgi:hypothetical protein
VILWTKGSESPQAVVITKYRASGVPRAVFLGLLRTTPGGCVVLFRCRPVLIRASASIHRWRKGQNDRAWRRRTFRPPIPWRAAAAPGPHGLGRLDGLRTRTQATAPISADVAAPIPESLRRISSATLRSSPHFERLRSAPSVVGTRCRNIIVIEELSQILLSARARANVNDLTQPLRAG